MLVKVLDNVSGLGVGDKKLEQTQILMLTSVSASDDREKVGILRLIRQSTAVQY